ncbi:hypothetical protein HHI36_004493 [Cryptolaemus montrouzieri]|uniref:BESS domain-containing protein n=1 Tax=Cryptolaemus montrouzieri TaxID=559131 RepID=A0ABD2NRJ2_9CUCU
MDRINVEDVGAGKKEFMRRLRGKLVGFKVLRINMKLIMKLNHSPPYPPNPPHSQSPNRNTPSAKAKMLHNLEECYKERMGLVSQLVNQKKEEDDANLFMKSIALTIKKLPPNSISQAKLQILTLVTNLQESSDSQIIVAAPPAPYDSSYKYTLRQL